MAGSMITGNMVAGSMVASRQTRCWKILRLAQTTGSEVRHWAWAYVGPQRPPPQWYMSSNEATPIPTKPHFLIVPLPLGPVFFQTTTENTISWTGVPVWINKEEVESLLITCIHLSASQSAHDLYPVLSQSWWTDSPPKSINQTNLSHPRCFFQIFAQSNVKTGTCILKRSHFPLTIMTQIKPQDSLRE